MTDSRLIVITGAGASTALGRGAPLPMMGEWCDRIMDDLDQQSLGLAVAIGLRRGMQGDEFERALGKFLQWHRALPLAEDFARLGESDPLGEVNPIVKEWLSQSLERLPIVVEIINRSLWREFGLERIDDDAALLAYGSLCEAVQAAPGGNVALFSATTNYDRSGEGGWTALGFHVDDGARESRPGGSRFLEVDRVVPWADSGTIPHLHLHGAVGWYKQSNRILVEPADREFEPRWVPAVLYPDPNKDPYGDSGLGVDALWSCFERALAQATHALVLGHSLHDRPLLAALARRLTGPPIRIAISYYGENTSAARPIMEQLASTPLGEEDVDLSLIRVAFGPDPQLEDVREWMAGEQVRVLIHDEEAAEPPAAVSQPAQVLRREDFDVLQGEAQQVLEGSRVGIGLRHVVGEPSALIVLRDPPPQNFSMDCDVFLEPGGLLNILFGFDRANWQGYMARVDTRPYPPEGDCILWMEDGHHGVWSPEMQAKVNSPAGQWFPVSLRIEDGSCVFFRQEQPLLRLTSMKSKNGTIGFFTELATSHVANVRVRSLRGS